MMASLKIFAGAMHEARELLKLAERNRIPLAQARLEIGDSTPERRKVLAMFDVLVEEKYGRARLSMVQAEARTLARNQTAHQSVSSITPSTLGASHTVHI